MDTLNNNIKEYTIQLSKGQIQKAYKGIMTFMTELKSYLQCKYSEYATSALYFGYMDMTYIAFTPSDFRNRKLKIAIVYMHEECQFELWLAGINRQIQADYINLLSHKNIGNYTLSKVQPGVDSIIASVIIHKPDFDNTEKLKKEIELKTMQFVEDINSMLNQ